MGKSFPCGGNRLMKRPHIYPNVTTSLRVIRDGCTPQSLGAIRSPADAALILTRFYAGDGQGAETFVLLALDAQHRVIGNAPVVVTRGLANSCLVHPREVFAPAILLGAVAIVVAHNHPSGDPTPSAEDRSITAQLVSAGKLLDIPIHDHLIIGNGRYVSFADAGLL